MEVTPPNTSATPHAVSPSKSIKNSPYSTALPRPLQILLNATLFFTSVIAFSLIAGWFIHACLLKCTPLEIAIRILTVFIFPLSFFLAKSPIGLLARTFSCAILAVTLTLAYGNWLHSDNFPRGLARPCTEMDA